jgi:hypothetical protein
MCLRLDAGIARQRLLSSDGDHFIKQFILVPPRCYPPRLLAPYAKSWLEKKRLKEMRRDLREAALATVILMAGVWMIIAGLMEL